MAPIIPYIALAVGMLFTYKLTQWYLRRFRAVWWQGYLIGFPTGFIGLMPIHAFDSPDWLRKLGMVLVILTVVTAYQAVKQEQQPASTNSKRSA